MVGLLVFPILFFCLPQCLIFPNIAYCHRLKVDFNETKYLLTGLFLAELK